MSKYYVILVRNLDWDPSAGYEEKAIFNTSEEAINKAKKFEKKYDRVRVMQRNTIFKKLEQQDQAAIYHGYRRKAKLNLPPDPIDSVVYKAWLKEQENQRHANWNGPEFDDD